MIRKQTLWVNDCEGCQREYGWHDNKEKAEAFDNAFPLCHDCDGENY